MTIRLLKGIFIDIDTIYKIGDVLDLPKDGAEHMIETGNAELVIVPSAPEKPTKTLEISK